MSQMDAWRARRREVLAELAGLERMRRGSVVEQYVESVRGDGTRGRRGPYPLYTFKRKGKTVSRRLRSAEEAQRCREEIAQFRRFRELVAELVELGERMSAQAPPPAEAVKNADVELEKNAEVARFLRQIAAERRVDLEAWEFGLRRTVLAAGAGLLEEVLKGVGSGRRRKVICACGGRMRSVGLRAKTLQTVLGPVAWRRSLFVCPACGRSQFPGDAILNVVKQSASPGLRRLMARAGSQSPFGEAAEDLAAYAELDVDAKLVERTAEEAGRLIERWTRSEAERVLMLARRPPAERVARDLPVLYVSFDGTGIPMRRSELIGRKGKGPGGEAHTREVKLGCIFTQTRTRDDGEPVRDPASTTYVGGIEGSEAFGWRLYAEALRRGLDRARLVAILTDGARYCQSVVATHFPGAIHIVDRWHAGEHLSTLAELLAASPRLGAWNALLDAGRIESLTRAARRRLPARGLRRKEALREIAYFADNAERMRYARFRDLGLFIGSGVIEAGCRAVIGQRLKQSGMFWSLSGANAIIAVRCCLLSGRFEQFWEDEAA